MTPWLCLWLPGSVCSSLLHPSSAEQSVAWHCRPNDTNPSWAQQRSVARGWHLISCFPGVCLSACSLLLQITVECSGVWNSMQKVETGGWRSCSQMLNAHIRQNWKEDFWVQDIWPQKQGSSSAVTSSYITVILSCAEWEPEKGLDRTGALLLISEYDWMKVKFQCVPACRIYCHRNRKFPGGGNWRVCFKEN